MKVFRVLLVGAGHMGASHAFAYHELPGFEIVGLVSRGDSAVRLNSDLGSSYPVFKDYATALANTRPDVVNISTYPDTHAAYARMALEAGAHVFVEKPLADNVKEAKKVADLASSKNLKLVVGYILRVHPAWQSFIVEAQKLGKPLVMRLNLNQQSQGHNWEVHKSLMQSLSPIVDCGVHYIDVMNQMTEAHPVSVSAIGVRLSDEIPDWNYNYGQLQIRFSDGSVGWYEAGWGPMMSETAFFIKDVIGPKGSVSIMAKTAGGTGQSENVEAHTKTESLKIHSAKLNEELGFEESDRWVDFSDEPNHNELVKREQEFLYEAIVSDKDLSSHLKDAVNSLKIALAADKSVKTGKTVFIKDEK